MSSRSTSRESRPSEMVAAPGAGAVPGKEAQQELSDEEIERKTKSILEEYLHLNDLKVSMNPSSMSVCLIPPHPHPRPSGRQLTTLLCDITYRVMLERLSWLADCGRLKCLTAVTSQLNQCALLRCLDHLSLLPFVPGYFVSGLESGHCVQYVCG